MGELHIELHIIVKRKQESQFLFLTLYYTTTDDCCPNLKLKHYIYYRVFDRRNQLLRILSQGRRENYPNNEIPEEVDYKQIKISSHTQI